MENPAIRKALTREEAFWRSEQERRFCELREKALRFTKPVPWTTLALSLMGRRVVKGY